MTAILAKAFKQASKLPAPLQEQLASQLLDDMAGEAKWDAALASPTSQQLLETMATRALKASRTGKTHRKGFGEP